MATIHQVNVSNGGVPKRPIAGAYVSSGGVAGDAQADLVHHGGPLQAVCLFSLEVIEGLRAEGHPIQAGYAGENLTVSGLEWDQVVPGVRLKIGSDLELEITDYTSPCSKNAAWFKDRDFTRVSQTKHPGESRVYARVVSEGHVTVGDEVRLV